ncbi:MAG: precorrin-3B C(17)-methyltransferase [Synergistaceae bacterium]|nr:precorrin-3B C(17)-methyltransferase [Synergistaceae bacterium]
MIYVIGIGPGSVDEITPRAMEAMKSCDVIAGYTLYAELVRDSFPDKQFVTSGMRSERERCLSALKLSSAGKTVALISSGDSGVYGMAGLMLELARDSGQEVKVIPGITAANSCAAILGAPLMNDYVTISLSDLMTDWSIIEKRLTAACTGDFVICIYNPASRHRPDNFRKACELLMTHKSPETPAGYVRNAGREGETHEVLTLGEIINREIDMLCTIIIGNSQTYIIDGKIITHRGYNIAQT